MGDKSIVRDEAARRRRNKFWFFLNIIFTLIYLYWRVVYTVPLKYGTVSKVAGIILTVAIAKLLLTYR